MDKEIRKKTGRLRLVWIPLLIVIPLLAAFVCLLIGRNSVSPRETIDILWKGIAGKIEKPTTASVTILSVRLPRILTAMLVGAGLSVAGCAFQSLFANPLATPDTVGVAGGASFGAALGLLFGLSQPYVQALAFGMGLLATILTFGLGKTGRRKNEMNAVVLSGIMIGSLFSALVSFVKFSADSETKLPEITYFLMGSFKSASYRSLLIGAIPIVIGILLLFLLRFRMNLLTFSEDEVRSFGVNMKRLRTAVLILSTMITASCVALSGQVGWIGLLIPHMCRMAFKNNHLSLIPTCVSFGAVFVVLVDTVARSISASEIPISVFTAVIGAPFFIYLMKKTGGWSL